MDVWEAARRRYSVRAYDPAAGVSDEEVAKLLAVACEAPSAGNLQPWRFFVVRDPGARRRLAEAAYGQGFVAEAPVVIVVCAEPGRSAARYGARGERLYCIQDTAAAITQMLLAATALGLGTCWVGAFEESAAAQALALPGTLRPVALIPIGRPASQGGREASRRPLDEVVENR